MEWEQVRFPGRAAVHRRILDQCGPGSRFAELGARFGDWVALGRDAPPATVAEVEPYVAGYLDQAARVGRHCGTVAGIVLGTSAAATIAGGGWFWAVLR